jgi:hypothetical protein
LVTFFLGSIIIILMLILHFGFVSGKEIGSKRDVDLSPPKLDQSSLKVFKIMGARLGNETSASHDRLPPALVATPQAQMSDKMPRQVIFKVPTLFNRTAGEIFAKYRIPTYRVPSSEVSKDRVFSPPTFVIPQILDNDTQLRNGGYFTLTPILHNIFPNMTVLLDGIANPINATTTVDQIKFTLDKEGRSVGFSFAISAEIPEGLKIRKTSKFNTTLFLNIDYVGELNQKPSGREAGKINFSDPNSFISSPEIVIAVSKSLAAEKLGDGCPKMAAGLFNDETGKWQPAKINRTKAEDTAETCSYNLLTQHFSKFAVGGVVPPTQLTPT